jgi:hypothetical protein
MKIALITWTYKANKLVKLSVSKEIDPLDTVQAYQLEIQAAEELKLLRLK